MWGCRFGFQRSVFGHSWSDNTPPRIVADAQWWGWLQPNAASFFKWGPGVCTQIVAKGYVVDSGRPNALGYRTVARPLQMRERARHRAIRAFQRHSWRRVPCKKGP